MQKEKPTKVYNASKNQSPKKPKKQGPGFLDNFWNKATGFYGESVAFPMVFRCLLSQGQTAFLAGKPELLQYADKIGKRNRVEGH